MSIYKNLIKQSKKAGYSVYLNYVEEFNEENIIDSYESGELNVYLQQINSANVDEEYQGDDKVKIIIHNIKQIVDYCIKKESIIEVENEHNDTFYVISFIYDRPKEMRFYLDFEFIQSNFSQKKEYIDLYIPLIDILEDRFICNEDENVEFVKKDVKKIIEFVYKNYVKRMNEKKLNKKDILKYIIESNNILEEIKNVFTNKEKYNTAAVLNFMQNEVEIIQKEVENGEKYTNFNKDIKTILKKENRLA